MGEKLPERGAFPDVDDHLVEPEVTRDEIIGGRRMVASPAEAPKATLLANLNYLIRAHVSSGYSVARDLITRFDEDSNFATDVAVLKNDLDPATGGRHLEEIVFVVVSQQNQEIVREKTVRMHRRGVRRIFTVWLEERQVCEWSPEIRNWRPVKAAAQIEDRCLVRPLAVAPLLDARLADDAVAEALIAKGNEPKGKARGFADAILIMLEARGIAVGVGQRQEILGCPDLERLNRWLRRALQASSLDEITSEP